jgi:hypothetical protein
MLDKEPEGLTCEFAGHCWRDAGGGLEICALCGAERWADEDGDTRIRWRRVEGEARVYVSTDEGYEIIWDPAGERVGEPGGWYLWEGGLLHGIWPTLRDAKRDAGERRRR